MKTFKFKAAVTLLLVMSSLSLRAIGPHELLVIANENSIDSILVARAYMRMRSIPEVNLIRITLPEAAYASGNLITPADFTEQIWEPVQAAISERGLQSQILAWAFSCDFPTRVDSDPQMSLTGLTFMRNRIPDKDTLTRGSYLSPLFAGPEGSDEPRQETRTFDQHRNTLLESMPLPAVMLGYTRERGNTLAELLAALEKGAASDSRQPLGTVFFSINDNIRSKSRHWQYEGAVAAIRQAGQQAAITNAFPSGQNMIGFMTGNRTAPADLATYEPGAYADHLTSFAAAFENASQTKISEWLRHGVSGTSGTVTEPFAVWHKFPNAYIFAHQLDGASMIEALYHATRCPLQLLPMGDPLAKPWAPKTRVTIDAPNKPVAGMVELTATCDDPANFTQFDWLLNGRKVARGRKFLWNSRSEPNGPHRIRAIAVAKAPMRHQSFQDVVIDVLNPEE